MPKKVMKKLLIILICLIPSMLFADDGILPDNLNFTLNNATRVEIKIVGTAQSGSSFLFHTKGESVFEMYKTATSTEPFTFNETESGQLGFSRNLQDTTLFWAILTSAASDTLEVIIFKNP